MTVASPDARRARMPSRRTLSIGLGVLLLFALLVALTPTEGDSSSLDPSGRGPAGARALVEVLRAHGVEVVIARNAAEVTAAMAGRDAARTTVAFGDPTFLRGSAVTQMAEATRSAASWVVLLPRTDLLDALDLDVTSGFRGVIASPLAACHSRVVRQDDVVDEALPAAEISVPSQATACFANGETAGWVELPDAESRPATTIVGIGDAFSNRRITAASHAGLAVRALGQHPTLLWVHADVTALPPQDDEALVWPSWLGPVGGVLLAAFVALALARGRRLGPLVPEALPVVVRAAETTASRGRLYHRARDRERAATALRAATRARVATRLGAGRDVAGPELATLAAAASGLDGATISQLLNGPTPGTDAELVTLATALADLEERVRRP